MKVNLKNSRKFQEKVCGYSGKRCFFSGHCDFFCCSTGDVKVCKNHGNPNGRFLPRKVVA